MIEVNQLKKDYIKKQTLFHKESHTVLKGISFNVKIGECLGIIGGSGNGKSTLSRILLGIEDFNSGSVTIDGVSHTEWIATNKGRLSIVFQDYQSSVNPNWAIKNIIAEPLRFLKTPKHTHQALILEIMKEVNLSLDLLEKYPHQLSGGQLQRVCIARALITQPKYLILDEAISSLDVSIQAQIIDLLIRLQQKYQLTYVFISHDLMAVANICNRVLFLHQGTIMEEIDCHQLREVKSEYARSLLDSVMTFDSNFKE